MIQRTLDSVNEPFSTPSAVRVEGLSSKEASQWKTMAPTALLIGMDATALVAALTVASLVATGMEAPMATWLPLGLLGLGLVIPALIGVLALAGVYAAPVSSSLGAVTVRTVAVLSFAGMALGAVGLLAPYPPDAATYTFAAWAAALVLVPTGRLAANPFLQAMHRHGLGRRPMIVVGTHPEVTVAAQALEARGGAYRLAGIIEMDASTERKNGSAGQTSTAESNGHSDLAQVLESVNGRHEFLLAASPAYLRQVETAVRPFLPDNAPVYLDLAVLTGSPATSGVGVIGNGMPAVRLKPRYECWRYTMAKRAMDMAVAMTALVVAAPIMLLIALAIKLDSPGPALFRQTRVGRYGRMFSMYKFRSMRPDAETIQAQLLAANEAKGPMFKIKDDPRITRVGKFIRRLSLDELPQLFNVLQGTMSIVGPRPPLPREVMEYQPWQLRRLEMTPGITGLWQVSRIETSSFEEMVQLDLQYTDRWSLAMDIRILLKTLPAMIMARGAY